MDKNNLNAFTEIENLIDDKFELFQQIESVEAKLFFNELINIIEEKNRLVLKQISEILKYDFFVDEYQRGYKWKPQQVRELLKDISTFEQIGDSFYCLQPIVVRHCRNDNNEPYWELIDGQQRITTIYMILKYLKVDNIYSIRYETRDNNTKFLENIDAVLKNETWQSFINQNLDFNNVDNFHFFEAYKAIDEFFKDKSDDFKDQWKDKLLNNAQVIWYTVKDEAKREKDKSFSIEIFMRLNSGKIPLTNSELIKALFLHNISNQDNLEIYKMKQNEMAQEWDTIEHSLQNNDFWNFFNLDIKQKASSTRIDILFDIVIGLKKSSDDPLYSFNEYQKKIEHTNNKEDEIQKLWQEIKECYYRLFGWYQNPDSILYHMIGFIVTRKLKNISLIYNKSKEVNTDIFENYIKKIISTELKKYFKSDNEEVYVLENLQYGKNNNRKIINTLILHNIYAHKKIGSRVSFKKYTNADWSLEHIHAQNSKKLSQIDEDDAWFKERESMLKDETNGLPVSTREELARKLEEAKRNGTKDNFEDSLKKEIGEFIEENEMNSITNLVLLDKSLNSSLSNKLFSKKRIEIMNWEKEGKFIPIATKNIFAKYYSKNIEHMYKWSSQDRKSYANVLCECLREYIPDIQSEVINNEK